LFSGLSKFIRVMPADSSDAPLNAAACLQSETNKRLDTNTLESTIITITIPSQRQFHVHRFGIVIEAHDHII